jgi:hypothetical protein
MIQFVYQLKLNQFSNNLKDTIPNDIFKRINS